MRDKRKRPPRDYRERPEVREAYEEGGRSIGRSIVHDPTKEEYYWKILGPLQMWPRWYLDAFRGLYADENPEENQRAIKKRYRQKKARARRRKESERLVREGGESIKHPTW